MPIYKAKIASCGPIRFEIWPRTKTEKGVIIEKFYPAELDKPVRNRLLYQFFHKDSFRRMRTFGPLVACPRDGFGRDGVCKRAMITLQIYHPLSRLEKLGKMCRSGELLKRRRFVLRAVGEVLRRIGKREK